MSAPINAPVASSTIRKWCVSSTGTFTLASMRAWSQLAATVPVQKARAHSGSYSFRFCGGSAPACAENSAASHAGSSRGAAATMPSQSPTLHWSPRYLLHSANIGPIAWRIDWPQAGATSEAKSGGSS